MVCVKYRCEAIGCLLETIVNGRMVGLLARCIVGPKKEAEAGLLPGAYRACDHKQ
jgi:hypothetical protein